jgi:hypothetical protein
MLCLFWPPRRRLKTVRFIDIDHQYTSFRTYQNTALALSRLRPEEKPPGSLTDFGNGLILGIKYLNTPHDPAS